MDIYHVIKRPLVTEKGTHQSQQRLRLGPMEERTIMVCTKRGREWTLAKMPTVRGAKVELYEDLVFADYYAAGWEIFRMRWKAVTGEEIA